MEAPNRLKVWRDERKLTQEQAAEAAGVHQNTWSDWENGKKAPRTEMAMRLEVLTDRACPVDAWATDEDLRKEWLACVSTRNAA